MRAQLPYSDLAPEMPERADYMHFDESMLTDGFLHEIWDLPGGEKFTFQELKQKLLSNKMKLMFEGNKIVGRIYRQQEKYSCNDAKGIWYVC